MSLQFRRLEFYPGQPEGEPPAPAEITNAFALISHEDGKHYFLQISGIGRESDEAKGYRDLAFDSIRAAKDHIINLPQNQGLKYVSMLMEQ
jgi:hypothetical protein